MHLQCSPKVIEDGEIEKHEDIGDGNFSGVISIILSLLITYLWGHIGPYKALTTNIIRDIPDFTVLIVPIFQPRHNTAFENVVCEMTAILSSSECIKMSKMLWSLCVGGQ